MRCTPHHLEDPVTSTKEIPRRQLSAYNLENRIAIDINM
ncbi:unnamed protein product [Nezara viridula]|uniref:Uncharacterized protein n=1 Tax=Nezara viridula TaxID=85310 RepID=A0A9P0EDR0_NEZVI|nr:unnamed protein product [Nezara viridula]